MLTVSIPRDLVADEEEQALFQEVAGDIAFALRGIELEEERKRAEEKLKQIVAELERFKRLTVGRELRMIELKRQVNESSERLGKLPPYDVSLFEMGEEGGGEDETGLEQGST